MDKNRFDGFARQLAQRENRRQALKTLLAGGLGTAAAVVAGREAEAAKPGADCCPGSAPKLCGLTCTAVASDPQNCGSCGNQCASDQTCVNGACTPAATRCKKAQDCPGTDTECQTRTCTKGACGYTYTANGTPVTNQTAGDCQQNVCDGAGNVTSIADNSDTPPSGDCYTGVCTAGTPSQPPVAAGTPCTGGVCNGSGACVVCVPGSTKSCYSGPAGSAGVGICAAGTQTCAADGSGYGACVGEVLPGTELCNGLDDDCDGQIDNNALCPAAPNATSVCIGGTCKIQSCDLGYSDCNNDPTDGCEVHTDSDPNNCGGCNNFCADGQTCTNGTCM